MRAGLLFGLAALGSLQAQAPQTARDGARPPQIAGTAGISGVVTAEPGNQPVRRAVVTVNGSDITTGIRASRVAVTDDRGRFIVPDLPAGRYTVTVSKGGWLTEYYGSKRPGRGPGSPIALADGEQAKAEMKLVRGAVITGRIVDEHGHPQIGVRPQLMEYRTLSGQRRLVPAPYSFAFFLNQTNDLGEYRLYGVAPGSYVVSAQPAFQMTQASGARMTQPEEVRWALQLGGPAPPTGGPAAPPQGRAVTYAPVFFPSVTDAAAATMVTVAAGEERSGIDIVMGLVATARIEGTITRPDGQPARGAQINIMSQNNNDMFDSGLGMMRPTVDPQGRFTFPAVRPGRYSVVARAPSQPPRPTAGPPAPGTRPQQPTLDLWGVTEITVEGSDITGLSIALQPGLNVSGRIVYEASTLTPPASLAGTRVMMASAAMLLGIGQTGTVPAAQTSSMFTGPTAADGTFTFGGVMPGNYMIMAPAGSGWMVKSTTAAGREVPGGIDVKAGEDLADIVITYTDRTSEISGVLLDAAGRPAPEYFVFVFPVDKSAWNPYSQRLRPPMRPASDGKFRIFPLPAGEYYMVALTDFEQENLYDAAFLEQVAAASFKITLGEGEKKVQDIKIK